MPEHPLNNKDVQVDINNVLGRKLTFYADFLSATLQLKNAFEAEDMGRVEELTMQREDMIRFVNGLDHEVNKTNRDDDGGGKERAVITNALNKTLQKIIEANKDCHSIAILKCNLAKGDLQTISKQDKVMSGYANNTLGIPKFLDVRT
ncbi:MAG TPA: hypothetical protein DCG53_09155 [Syntrophus sp. (in: bacteria)]|nr:hypothetical protein [Syntrophus sp. (in: bacteria)]